MPPPVDTNPDPITGRVETFRLERLEFGKLCVTLDGPIAERASASGQLGWSAGFPRKLVSLASSTAIGVRAHDFEEQPPGPHATVLRPVWLEGRVWPVLGRIGKRPEDGVGTESRLYTLARYLTAPSDVQAGTPVELWDLFKAMAPLRGVTEDEVHSLNPIVVEPAPASLPAWLEPPERKLPTRRFLQEALIYVMSGIPICIKEHVDEDLFFAWVSALWRLMPPGLRPYLSAGWGVGASQAGKLAISYVKENPEGFAEFLKDSESGRWKWLRAKKGFNHLRKSREPFQQGHLSAGVHYAWRLFGCKPYDELPRIGTFEESPEAEELTTADLPAHYAPAPVALDFQTPEISLLFIAPGLDARDQYLYEQCEVHLGYLAPGGDQEAADLSSEFTFQESKEAAFERAYGALGDRARRDWAESLLWWLLTDDDLELYESLIGEEDRPGKARICLFLALKGGDALGVLEALYLCAESGEAHSLSGDALEMLHDRLKPNLHEIASSCAWFHTSLLNLEDPPLDYLDWVKQHDLELALSALDKIEDVKAFYDRIIELTGSTSVRTLLNSAAGHPPSPEDDEAIRSLRAVSRYRFFGQLMERWNQYTQNPADHRERLLPWLRLAHTEGQPINDPLLSLAFGETGRIDDPDDIKRLALDDHAVPPSLRRQVSRLVLKNYRLMAPHIHQNVNAWRDVIRYWPEGVLAALYPGKEYGYLREATKSEGEDSAEAREMEMEMEDLEKLIFSEQASDPSVQQWLWRWAANARKNDKEQIPDAPTVQICQHILNAKNPLPRNYKPEHIRKARKLAETDEEMLLKLRRKAESDWSNATNGETMIVLLSFFPGVDFIPTPEQLAILWHYESRLIPHLEIDADQLHPNRSWRFRILTAPPLTLQYPKDGEVVWNDKYATYPFWIAFRGVPLGKQQPGALSETLKLHVPSGRASQVQVKNERAEMCRKYLNSYTDAELNLAIKQVLDEFVIPWLHHHERRDRTEITLFLLGPESGHDSFSDLVRMIKSFGKRSIIIDSIEKNFGYTNSKSGTRK